MSAKRRNTFFNDDDDDDDATAHKIDSFQMKFKLGTSYTPSRKNATATVSDYNNYSIVVKLWLNFV